MRNLLETLHKLGFEIDDRSHPTLCLESIEGDGKLCLIRIIDYVTKNSPNDDTKRFKISVSIEDEQGVLCDKFFEIIGR